MSVTFEVPPALEAGAPPEARGLRRDDVSLLVTDASIERHAVHRFNELAQFLRAGDLLVANNSATIPAALTAHDGQASFPLHLSTQVAANLWVVEPRSDRNFAAGTSLHLDAGAKVALLSPIGANRARLWYAILEVPDALGVYLARHGRPIAYGYVAHPQPLSAYQTIFAKHSGSAEMPSAGRPFSLRTLQLLYDRGVKLATLTLHCGVASPERHEPPSPEWMHVPPSTARIVNATRAAGNRIIAIGTSVVRALETAADSEGTCTAYRGWTEHIVGVDRPPRIVAGLLTGLHEPRASHLAMLESFTPAAVLGEAYDVALQEQLLWHEFGDVHLISP